MKDMIKVKAQRTNCLTNVVIDVELVVVKKYNDYLNSHWISIEEGGVTGFESMRFDLIPATLADRNGWLACAGTPNQWDKLFIPGEEMKKIYDYFSGNLKEEEVSEELPEEKEEKMMGTDNTIVSCSGGKYTFILEEGDWRVRVDRHGEPWLKIEQGHKAVSNLVLEMLEVKEALDKSVKLQSHYAKLLNQYDGRERICFSNEEEWLKELRKGKRGVNDE